MTARPFTVLFAVLFAAATLSPASAAEDGFSLFAKFREDARLTRMRFIQKNYDEQDTPTEETRGTIWYRSPNLFRLEYDESDKPLVVSDGVNIYIYEKDLQQVVVRRFNSSDEQGLLSVLLGGLDAMRNRYVFSSGAGGRLIWLAGEATAEDDPVPLVRLGFLSGDGGLRRLEMSDAFGGRLSLDIADFARGADARSDDDGEIFSFTPPPDTVVINSAE